MFRLLIENPASEGCLRVFERDVVRIGRDPRNELAIDDPALSLHHATIREESGVHVLSDLGSRNGTFLNGKRVETRALNSGDRVAFGPIVATFYEDSAGEPAPVGVDPVAFAVFGSTLCLGPSGQSANRERSADVHAHLVQPGKNEPPLIIDRDIFTFGKNARCDVGVPGFFAPNVAALIVRGMGGFSLVRGAACVLLKNGEAVVDRAWLADDDRIGILGTELVFKSGLPGEATPARGHDRPSKGR